MRDPDAVQRHQNAPRLVGSRIRLHGGADAGPRHEDPVMTSEMKIAVAKLQAHCL
jgi:hypothetical protein